MAAYLARLGSSRDPQPVPLRDLIADFDLSDFSHSPSRFDGSQLAALNRKILHESPFDAVRARLPDGATPAFWNVVRGNLDMLSEARLWWRVVAGTITPPVPDDADRAFLRDAAAVLPDEPWDAATWNTWTAAIKGRIGRKGRTLFMPLRLALTGEDHGPEFQGLLPLIGRPLVMSRLMNA